MKQKQFQQRALNVVPAVKQVLDETNSADNVKDLASSFFISRNTLQGAFKHELGIGIRKYKLKQRMEQAKQMLEEGKDIKEIAFTLNYSQTRNFSNAFKKYYGVIPTEWPTLVQNATTLCKVRPTRFGIG
jgi:AraC-like DNA-binding protein